MRQRSLIGAIAVAALLAMAPVAGQAQDISKYPDWSGQWRKPNGIGNGQWDVTKPAGRAQQPPLTPESQVIYEGRLAERAASRQPVEDAGEDLAHQGAAGDAAGNGDARDRLPGAFVLVEHEHHTAGELVLEDAGGDLGDEQRFDSGEH